MKFKIVSVSEEINEAEALQEFNETYVKTADLPRVFNTLPKEVVSALNAKILGETDVVIRKLAEDLDIELQEKTRDNIKLIVDKYKEIAEDYKGQIGSSSEELNKKLKDYEDKISALSEVKKDLATRLKEKEAEVENVKSTYTQKERLIIIENKRRDALSKVQLVDSEAHKKAVNFDLSSYTFEIDEEGKEIVKKGDEILKSTKQAGEFASYIEIIEAIAESNGAIKKNNASGFQSNYTPPTDEQRIRKARV
jgi:hypothetical protein